MRAGDGNHVGKTCRLEIAVQRRLRERGPRTADKRLQNGRFVASDFRKGANRRIAQGEQRLYRAFPFDRPNIAYVRNGRGTVLPAVRGLRAFGKRQACPGCEGIAVQTLGIVVEENAHEQGIAAWRDGACKALGIVRT